LGKENALGAGGGVERVLPSSAEKSQLIIEVTILYFLVS